MKDLMLIYGKPGEVGVDPADQWPGGHRQGRSRFNRKSANKTGGNSSRTTGWPTRSRPGWSGVPKRRNGPTSRQPGSDRRAHLETKES